MHVTTASLLGRFQTVDIQPLLQDISATELTAVRNSYCKEPAIVHKCLVLLERGWAACPGIPSHPTAELKLASFPMWSGNEVELKVSSLTFDLSLR